jgi:hypothetical protein
MENQTKKVAVNYNFADLDLVVRGWVQLKEIETDENGELVMPEEIYSPYYGA